MTRSHVLTAHTASGAESERFAAALGARITHGLGICLSGPLGSGKTVLARGLCRGLGVAGDIVSPTFILMETLAGRLPVAHVDLYRLERERDVEDLGVFDLLAEGVVVVIEWSERSPRLRDLCAVEITIEARAADERVLHVTADAVAVPLFRGLAW